MTRGSLMITLPTLAPVPLDTALYIGRAAFLVFSFALAAIAFARLSRSAERRGRDAERAAQHTSAQLARALERLDDLESQLSGIATKLTALCGEIETHPRSSAASSPQNYAIAIRLARAGLPPDELAANCGLARREAELVVRLHGRKERDARHVAPMPA